MTSNSREVKAKLMQCNNNKKSYENGFGPIPQLMREAFRFMGMLRDSPTLIRFLTSDEEAHLNAPVSIRFPLLVIASNHIILKRRLVLIH